VLLFQHGLDASPHDRVVIGQHDANAHGFLSPDYLQYDVIKLRKRDRGATHLLPSGSTQSAPNQVKSNRSLLDITVSASHLG
jgi:hypothetical protein